MALDRLKDPTYGEKFWHMTEMFFAAAATFKEIFDSYEDKVLKFARARGVDRKVLRLTADEVSTLFDLPALEKLRNGLLYDLKDTAHELFRTPNATDELDRYLSDIFHETSILKEQHYTVKTYAASYEDKEEAVKILDEAHENFPVKLNQMRTLFQKATQRLQEILVRENRQRILTRSLYMHGEKMLKPLYPEGLVSLYRIMYPGGGSAEGYLTAAKDFFNANFYDIASDALSKARSCLAVSDMAAKEKNRLNLEMEALATQLEPYQQAQAANGRH
jgi:hypothetical protein